MKTKNNTFKRIAAGALAAISVAAYAPANVGGILGNSASLFTVMAAEEAAVKRDIDFKKVSGFIDSITIDDVVFSNKNLQKMNGIIQAYPDEEITIVADTSLDFKINKPVDEDKNTTIRNAISSGTFKFVTDKDGNDVTIDTTDPTTIKDKNTYAKGYVPYDDTLAKIKVTIKPADGKTFIKLDENNKPVLKEDGTLDTKNEIVTNAKAIQAVLDANSATYENVDAKAAAIKAAADVVTGGYAICDAGVKYVRTIIDDNTQDVLYRAATAADVDNLKVFEDRMYSATGGKYAKAEGKDTVNLKTTDHDDNTETPAVVYGKDTKGYLGITNAINLINYLNIEAADVPEYDSVRHRDALKELANNYGVEWNNIKDPLADPPTPYAEAEASDEIAANLPSIYKAMWIDAQVNNFKANNTGKKFVESDGVTGANVSAINNLIEAGNNVDTNDDDQKFSWVSEVLDQVYFKYGASKLGGHGLDISEWSNWNTSDFASKFSEVKDRLNEDVNNDTVYEAIWAYNKVQEKGEVALGDLSSDQQEEIPNGFATESEVKSITLKENCIAVKYTKDEDGNEIIATDDNGKPITYEAGTVFVPTPNTEKPEGYSAPDSPEGALNLAELNGCKLYTKGEIFADKANELGVYVEKENGGNFEKVETAVNATNAQKDDAAITKYVAVNTSSVFDTTDGVKLGEANLTAVADEGFALVEVEENANIKPTPIIVNNTGTLTLANYLANISVYKEEVADWGFRDSFELFAADEIKATNFSKTVKDGVYTYTFKMPKSEIDLDTTKYAIQDLSTDENATLVTNEEEPSYADFIVGEDVKVKSKGAYMLDIYTNEFVKDSKGDKVQVVDKNGNPVYYKVDAGVTKFYSIVDNAAENGYKATVVTAATIDGATVYSAANGANPVDVTAEQLKGYTPLYEVEEVKVDTTRTSIKDKDGVITNYQYTFEMPDLADVAVGKVYNNAIQQVYIRQHVHEHTYEWTTSVDGTELYRECTDEDDGACEEENAKLLVSMIRNKVIDAEGKVTFDKTNKFTYTEGMNPVLLTLKFEDNKKPVAFVEGVTELADGQYNIDGFVYTEQALTYAGNVHAVVDYEDVEGSLGNGKTNANTGVGNYVVKATPAAAVNAANEELSFYFAINAKQLTFDNIRAEHGSSFDAKKNLIVIPTAADRIEDADFRIVDGDNVLHEGTDYIIIGSKAATEAGNYTFTVKGIGNYTGAFQVKWTLKETAATIELKPSMITISSESGGNGTFAKRVLSVKALDEFGRLTDEDIKIGTNEGEIDSFLVSGPEYATEKGVYNISVQGIGQYYGTVNLQWNVTRADITGKPVVVGGANFDTAEKKLGIEIVGALRDYTSSMGTYVEADEQTLTSVGLIATQDYSLTDDMDVNSDDPAIYVRSKSGAEVESKKSYVLTWKKSNSTANDVWYVKPYKTFKIGTTTITEYGELTRVQGNTAEIIEKGSAKVRTTKCGVADDANNTGKKVLSTNSYLAIPDGCTMLKAGVVASTNRNDVDGKTVAANEKQSTANGLYVRFKEGNDVAPYQRYSFTWKKSNVAVGDEYYIKPFVQYKDADGVIHTVCGDVQYERVTNNGVAFDNLN